MTINEILKKYNHEDAELLLAHVLKREKQFLFLHPEYRLTPSQLAKFKQLHQKRMLGVPTAYLLGYKYFYGYKFKVTPDVLIPRPESEWLVDEAVKFINQRRGKLNILEAGTGSGCIIISLGKTIAKTHQLTGVDISSKALAVTRANAKTLGVKVSLGKADVTKPFGKQKYDLIIANLPYVPKSEYKKYEQNLKSEPKLAITDNTETGELICKFLIVTFENGYLAKRGRIILEIDPLLVAPIKATLKHLPSVKSVKFYKDIHKLYRYAIIDAK